MKLYFEFHKKNPDSKEGYIRVVIINSGKKELISTGIKLSTKNWGEGKPKTIAANTNINLALKKYEAAFDKYLINTELANEIPSLSSAKEYIYENINSSIKERGQKDLRELLMLFKAEKKGHIREGAIKPYTSMINHLYDYNPKIQFADITNAWADKFKNFLSEKSRHIEGAVNLQNGSINKQIVSLKAFCRWAYDNKHTSATAWQKITKIQNVINQRIIALTLDEFNKYANYDFSNNKPVEQQRDIFCFGCYTGLRFQDLKRVKESIKKSGNDYYLHLNTQKNSKEVKMRLVDEAVLILKKYDFSLPLLSNQKTNKQIKAGIKKCGITRQETVVIQHLTKVSYPKQYIYELISIHDSRKTFITRCLEAGMSITEIMSLSTHTDMRSLMRYIDLERERVNQKLQSVFAMKKVS